MTLAQMAGECLRLEPSLVITVGVGGFKATWNGGSHQTYQDRRTALTDLLTRLLYRSGEIMALVEIKSAALGSADPAIVREAFMRGFVNGQAAQRTELELASLEQARLTFAMAEFIYALAGFAQAAQVRWRNEEIKADGRWAFGEARSPLDKDWWV